MKKIATIGALVLGGLALPAVSAQAQRYGIDAGRRAWLGISYEVTMQREGGDFSQTLVLTDVVDGSPAEQAGLQVGDTLLRVNDIAATDQLLSSLAVSLKPGDSVRLRIRRDGRERELEVEAGTPPASYYRIAPQRGIVTFDADSLRGRLSIMLDSARLHLDSLRLPNFYVERLPGGIRFGTDSAWVRVLPFDSFSVRIDSLTARFQMFGDSLFRRDSLRTWYFPHGERLRAFHLDSADLRGAWNFRFDTAGVRHLDPLPFGGITMWGARAVGGAELTELNPALGEYFGTDHGVLVVRVPRGTPADEAGLRGGDVIVGADGRDIDGIEELRRILRAPARSVRLEVLRKGERVTIEFQQD